MMAAPLIGLASAGFSGAGSLVAGEKSAADAKYQAALLDRESQYGVLKATQTNAALTRNLSDSLARIDAVRAASHASPGSPMTAEIRGQMDLEASRQKEIRVTNFLEQSQMDESQAAYLRNAASTAMMSGMIGAGGDIFGGLAKFAGGLNLG
jgi:hypothetical protein